MKKSPLFFENSLFYFGNGYKLSLFVTKGDYRENINTDKAYI